jgi:hypothetical protein
MPRTHAITPDEWPVIGPGTPCLDRPTGQRVVVRTAPTGVTFGSRRRQLTSPKRIQHGNMRLCIMSGLSATPAVPKKGNSPIAESGLAWVQWVGEN